MDTLLASYENFQLLLEGKKIRNTSLPETISAVFFFLSPLTLTHDTCKNIGNSRASIEQIKQNKNSHPYNLSAGICNAHPAFHSDPSPISQISQEVFWYPN